MCPFSKERGKKVGNSETPKRPRFPGCPLKGGFLPSGHRQEDSNQDDGKGRLSLKGGSLHDGFGGFDGFGGSGVHLALLMLVLQNTVPRDDRDGFGGFGGCGGFGRGGYLP